MTWLEKRKEKPKKKRKSQQEKVAMYQSHNLIKSPSRNEKVKGFIPAFKKAHGKTNCLLFLARVCTICWLDKLLNLALCHTALCVYLCVCVCVLVGIVWLASIKGCKLSDKCPAKCGSSVKIANEIVV